MKSRPMIVVLSIVASMLACNLQPTGSQPQDVNPAAISASDTPVATQAPAATSTETAVPAPTDTPTITPTATPSVPMVTPLKDAVNCRLGYGTEYEQLAGLAIGAFAQIVGKSSDGAWWQILSSGGEKCWVAASVTVVSGDISGVPVMPQAMAYVTDASILSVKPKSVNAPGCMGPIQPISIKGRITVNGPVTVKWHFETQKDGPMSTHTTEFSMYGYKDVSTDYTPPVLEGSYWIRLVITSPSSMVGESEYEIKC